MDFVHLKKTPSSLPPNKKQETDSQMLIRISRKFILVFIFILMFDTLLDVFLGVLDLLFEGIHILIEAIEYSIEVILELTLNTDHQSSEMIIVNSAIIVFLYLLYLLYRSIPKLYSKLSSSFSRYLDRKTSDWQELSLSHKIKLITLYSICSVCLILFLPI